MPDNSIFGAIIDTFTQRLRETQEVDEKVIHRLEELLRSRDFRTESIRQVIFSGERAE